MLNFKKDERLSAGWLGWFNDRSEENRQRIDKMMSLSPLFSYSASEGGWVSNDRSVILVTSRFPYNGRLMCLGPDVSEDTAQYWFDTVRSICDLYNQTMA